MALVGRLEDLELTELFHVLSLFRKTGKLTLSHGDRTGVFLFNNGKIFHATNGSPRPSLGYVLLSRDVISQEVLDEALELQKQGGAWKRLGAILVDMGAVERETLDDVLRGQLQEVVEEFLHWDSGFFSFKPVVRDENVDQVESQDDNEISDGVNTDHFILELLTKLDEVDGGGQVRPARTKPQAPVKRDEDVSSDDLGALFEYMVDPEPYADVADESAAGVQEWPSDLAELRSLMVEIQLRPAAFTGEIALLILRYATRVVNRGLLLGVGLDRITGIGQFGIGWMDDLGPSVNERVRRISIPSTEPSVLFEVIERMTTYHGPLKSCRWNNYLVDQLGGETPPEVLVIPIVVDGMIVAIFYGDNLPGGHPITGGHGLELLMIEAGLAMEKKLLRAKLQGVEEKLRAFSGEREELP